MCGMLKGGEGLLVRQVPEALQTRGVLSSMQPMKGSRGRGLIGHVQKRTELAQAFLEGWLHVRIGEGHLPEHFHAQMPVKADPAF